MVISSSVTQNETFDVFQMIEQQNPQKTKHCYVGDID